MGLSWQQGPLGRDPNGTFIAATPMPERVLYMEPLRRRMSVELGGSTIARSDEAVILFEPGRYHDEMVRRSRRRRRDQETGCLAARRSACTGDGNA